MPTYISPHIVINIRVSVNSPHYLLWDQGHGVQQGFYNGDEIKRGNGDTCAQNKHFIHVTFLLLLPRHACILFLRKDDLTAALYFQKHFGKG